MARAYFLEWNWSRRKDFSVFLAAHDFLDNLQLVAAGETQNSITVSLRMESHDLEQVLTITYSADHDVVHLVLTAIVSLS